VLTGVAGLPRLTVTQEQPAHFAVIDQGAVWPGFNHAPGRGKAYANWYSPVYGMPTPGEGIKAGWHGVGPVVDPDRRSFAPEPRQRAAMQEYARRWLPGVDPDSLTDISCTYTTTADENFVLDRIGPVVIGAGFSGHGFKFTPVVGRILADLATGEGSAPAIFSASRPGVR
jgi:sarcosine oxidase